MHVKPYLSITVVSSFELITRKSFRAAVATAAAARFEIPYL